MNVHAALEGLVDWWQERRDRSFRAALRRRLRSDKIRYINKGPDPRCVVHNDREPRR